MRVSGKIVDVSDTEVLTVESLDGGRGEQLYRAVMLKIDTSNPLRRRSSKRS